MGLVLGLIGPSRRAIIDKRGALALRQDGVARGVFDDRILDTTGSRWAVPLCVQLAVMPKDTLLVDESRRSDASGSHPAGAIIASEHLWGKIATRPLVLPQISPWTRPTSFE
jgi:hypothetical protein